MTHPGELLSAYLDGEATSADREEVTGHLGGCSECRADLEGLQAARAALRSLPMVEVPAGLLSGEGAEVAPLHRSRLAYGRRWAATMAAVLVLVIGLATLAAPTPPIPVSMQDLSTQFGARKSLDPVFNPARLVVQVPSTAVRE
ncbi:MAG: anti-sigma factor family protein [Acidimicrobiia bacterium]